MSDKPSIHERLVSAFATRALSLEVGPGARCLDADHVMALGMAAHWLPPAAGETIRLQASSTQVGYRTTRNATRRLAWRLAKMRGWTLSARNVERAADLALAHYMFPSCPECSGRGFEVLDGAPVLSGRACRACHGSGKRPVQARWHDEIVAVIAELETMTERTERVVRRLLR